jgi:hypothetical protein
VTDTSNCSSAARIMEKRRRLPPARQRIGDALQRAHLRVDAATLVDPAFHSLPGVRLSCWMSSSDETCGGHETAQMIQQGFWTLH